MTRTSPTTLAVAADYADAMLVARRWKNILFLALFVVIVAQLAMFFSARFVPSIHIRPGESSATVQLQQTVRIFEFATDLTVYLGVLLPIVLAMVLLLIVIIMLVGRLVGVSHVTGAFCMSILLVCLMFPWQSLLNSRAVQAAGEIRAGVPLTTQPTDIQPMPDVRLPGALYTWPELVRNYDFSTTSYGVAILGWARFAVFPVVMLIILLMVHARSSRGLRFALGEAEVHVEVTPTTT